MRSPHPLGLPGALATGVASLVVGLASCFGFAAPSTAQAGSTAAEFTVEPGAVIPRVCGTRDVATITLIEQYGEAGTVPAEVLTKAAFAVTEARNACHEGRILGALAVYDAAVSIMDAARSSGPVGLRTNP